MSSPQKTTNQHGKRQMDSPAHGQKKERVNDDSQEVIKVVYELIKLLHGIPHMFQTQYGPGPVNSRAKNQSQFGSMQGIEKKMRASSSPRRAERAERPRDVQTCCAAALLRCCARCTRRAKEPVAAQTRIDPGPSDPGATTHQLG